MATRLETVPLLIVLVLRGQVLHVGAHGVTDFVIVVTIGFSRVLFVDWVLLTRGAVCSYLLHIDVALF